MVGLRNVWICAQDLQLIRGDRIVSLLVPIATGYGAASPHDPALQTAVCAEVEGGTGGETVTRVQLADCGKTPAAELLTGLASALGSAATADSGEGCTFVFAERNRDGFTRWALTSQLPATWPQSTPSDIGPVALTRSPLAGPYDAS